ncbi:MAG: cellulase family glycosylhydrolase, partial [Planctomycetota bacterium]
MSKTTKAFFVLVAAMLLISGVATGASDCSELLPGPILPNGFGVNIHFRGQPGDLDMIADAGFKLIRMDLTWALVEHDRGIYEFDKLGYDSLTEGCAERGIRLLYILDYSNTLYEKGRSVTTQAGREAFAAFAEAAAERYAGRGILWEIWNEPNIKHFWDPQPSVDDYCKLVQLTAPRIKKADPNGLVVAGATSQIPFEWLEGCFKRGLLEWIDVLSVHPYRSQPPETVTEDYAELRRLVTQYAGQGKQVPVISGEWGYSNLNWDKTRLSEQEQAEYLARMFLTNLHQGIDVSIWYDWKNDGTDPNEREHQFGTVGHDGNPKAAYLAAKVLSSTL